MLCAFACRFLVGLYVKPNKEQQVGAEQRAAKVGTRFGSSAIIRDWERRRFVCKVSECYRMEIMDRSSSVFGPKRTSKVYNHQIDHELNNLHGCEVLFPLEKNMD